MGKNNVKLVYITPTGQWRTKHFDSVLSARKYGGQVSKRKDYCICCIHSYHNTKTCTVVKSHKL